jgi:hypothetical protein
MITLRPVSEAQWPALSAGFRDLGFEQSLTYGAAAARRIGAGLRFVVLERDGQPLAAAAVRIKTLPGLGRGIAFIAGGPLILPGDGPGPDAATLTAILTALRQEFALTRGHILRLRLSGLAGQDPDRMLALAGAAGFAPSQRAAPYRSMAIDLTQDEATLMAGLNGKWRTDLRAAQKAGLTLASGNDAALQGRFLTLYTQVQAAKGFRTDVPPEFHFALAGPDYRLEVLIAAKDGVDLAGIVIATVGGTVVYLFGATAEAGRALRAGYFLTWEGIALSRQRGLRWYDLGGIDAAANPDVARFKTRMNGVALNAPAVETAGPGPVPALIRGLEALRARLRR